MTKSRLEAFSDGVFAIAITLLIIDVTVPSVGPGRTLAHQLARQWPQYAAFAVSFLVIGIIWVNHHDTIARLERVDRKAGFLNLVLLAAVAFFPFPTALIAEYVRAGGATAHVAAAVYSANALWMAISFNLIWLYSDRAGLHGRGAGVRDVPLSRYLGTPIYTALIGLSFISAPVTLAVHGLLAIFYAVDTAAEG